MNRSSSRRIHESLIAFSLAFCGFVWASPPSTGVQVKIDPECHARLLAVRERGKETGKSVALGEQGVEFHGNRFKKLRAVFDSQLGTVRYQTTERIPAGTQALVPLFHGNGADYSHSGAMLNALSVLNSRGEKTGNRGGERGRRPSLTQELSRSPEFLPIAAEAIDFPFHGAGPWDERFHDLSTSVEWLATELRQLRALAPELPIVPIARSGSTGMLTTLIQKHPGLIDGMILLSPVHPIIDLEESIRYEDEQARSGVYIRNEEGMTWIVGMLRQMQPVWGWHADPFGAVPTLVLTGAEDTDVLPGIRAAFNDFVRRSRERGIPSEAWDVPGMKHDVISVRPPETALQVYRRIYGFVKTVAEYKRHGR